MHHLGTSFLLTPSIPRPAGVRPGGRPLRGAEHRLSSTARPAGGAARADARLAPRGAGEPSQGTAHEHSVPTRHPVCHTQVVTGDTPPAQTGAPHSPMHMSTLGVPTHMCSLRMHVHVPWRPARVVSGGARLARAARARHAHASHPCLRRCGHIAARHRRSRCLRACTWRIRSAAAQMGMRRRARPHILLCMVLTVYILPYCGADLVHPILLWY